MEAIYRAVLFMYDQPHTTSTTYSEYQTAKAVVDLWTSDEFYGKVKTGHVEVAVPVWGKA